MIEIQLDTIVGPTHYYGGLSYGNVASMNSRFMESNPKQAALEGLEKMKLIHELGVVQLVFPPQIRPSFETLMQLGFSGTDQEIIEKAYETAPDILLKCSSQSAMWTANAAIVSASADTHDRKVHITPANLSSTFHRSIEARTTKEWLKKAFPHFIHHPPLPSTPDFADEGAANATRFVFDNQGISLFVYGKKDKSHTEHYPARESKQALEAIARQHELDEKRIVYAQQNPKAIDKGVFHNDVIATGHEDLFFFHEEAYTNTQRVLDDLLAISPLTLVAVRKNELSVEDAVKTYIFNSQIVRLPSGERVIICPMEVHEHPQAKAIVEKRLPVDRVYYLPLNQSMHNGGGPACLRLRVPLTEDELQRVTSSFVFTPELYSKIKEIINKYYPEHYSPKKLLDNHFRETCALAVKALHTLLWDIRKD